MTPFSVVIPLYNKQGTVERAVRSVLAQTVQDFEIVVVNDGSTDDSPQVVARIEDSRIRLIHQANQGVSAARNRGIAEARHDLVAFLDADDEWIPTFLETITRLRSDCPDAGVFATAYLFSNECRGTWAPVFRGMPAGPWEGILADYFGVAAESDPPLWTSAVVVKKECILAVGCFPVGVTDGEDLLTWARLAANYTVAYANRACAVFWVPVCLEDRPGRNDYSEDVVGSGLRRLFDNVESDKQQGLRDYIFRWHKSTASILLELGQQDMARREIRQAFRYRCLSPKMWVYFLCSLLPSSLSRRCVRHTLGIWRSFRVPSIHTRRPEQG
jgi:glycosyltransferase involved in cell wall biosynthesis